MTPLPPIEELISRCKALAALDLIFSPEWAGRYYSFNSKWSPNEQMASMGDGSGDEWWIVFHDAGWAALRGFGHESPAFSKHRKALSSALQLVFPNEMSGFLNEPAFRWEYTSFAYFLPTGAAAWTRANDLAGYSAEDAGDEELLAHLVGTPSDYVRFAEDYYQTQVSEHLVAEIFALQPITASIVKSLNPATSLDEVSEELYREIQYPKGAQ